ncbi:hypothetical protein P7C70_g3106, partial [Phenoliferia sp. Uapishka_3]
MTNTHSQLSTNVLSRSSDLAPVTTISFVDRHDPFATVFGSRDLHYNCFDSTGTRVIVHYSALDSTLLASFQDEALNSEVDGFLATSHTYLASQTHRLPWILRQCTPGRSMHKPDDSPSVTLYRDDLFLQVGLLRSGALVVQKTLVLAADFPVLTTRSLFHKSSPPSYQLATAPTSTNSATPSQNSSNSTRRSNASSNASASASTSQQPRSSRDVGPKGGASVTSVAARSIKSEPARDDSLEAAMAAFLEATAMPSVL